MNLKPINNFEELKQSILKIIDGEGEIKAVPISVELSGANNTTTVTYETEVDNGQLSFSLVYPQGQQNDFNQITEINLFFSEQSKPTIGDTVATKSQPFSAASDLEVHFYNTKKYRLDVFTNIESLTSYTQAREQVSAQINTSQVYNRQPSSKFKCTIGYGEILELLSVCPPVFTELYSKIVGTSEIYSHGDFVGVLIPSIFRASRHKR